MLRQFPYYFISKKGWNFEFNLLIMIYYSNYYSTLVMIELKYALPTFIGSKKYMRVT